MAVYIGCVRASCVYENKQPIDKNRARRKRYITGYSATKDGIINCPSEKAMRMFFETEKDSTPLSDRRPNTNLEIEFTKEIGVISEQTKT